MHCANFPRHLGRLITRCLIAHPEGADTIELAHWAYGEPSAKSGSGSRTLDWLRSGFMPALSATSR